MCLLLNSEMHPFAPQVAFRSVGLVWSALTFGWAE